MNETKQNITAISPELPTLDLNDYEKKVAAGIFSWRYDEQKQIVFLDVKEYNGGIETGKVFNYPFSEIQLGKIENEHKGRQLMFDSQVLALQEAKENEERFFAATYKLISEAVKAAVKKTPEE